MLSLIQWVHFTKQCEEAINRSRLDNLKAELGKQLTALTSEKSEGHDAVLKIKVKSLVLDTIHFLAVVDELMAANAKSTEDWAWQRQMRYYYKAKGEKSLVIAMGTASQVIKTRDSQRLMRANEN